MSYLLELNSDERFRLLVKQTRKSRPIVPIHDSVKDNTEEWKYKSALQRGYDLCALNFGIKEN